MGTFTGVFNGYMGSTGLESIVFQSPTVFIATGVLSGATGSTSVGTVVAITTLNKVQCKKFSQTTHRPVFDDSNLFNLTTDGVLTFKEAPIL